MAILAGVVLLATGVQAFTFNSSSGDVEVQTINLNVDTTGDDGSGTITLTTPATPLDVVSLGIDEFTGESINIGKGGPGLELGNKNHTGWYEHQMLEKKYYSSLSLSMTSMTEVASSVEVFLSVNDGQYFSLGTVSVDPSMPSTTQTFDLKSFYNGISRSLQFRLKFNENSTAIVTNVSIGYDNMLNAGELTITQDPSYADKYTVAGGKKQKSIKLILSATGENMSLKHMKFIHGGVDGYANQVDYGYLYNNVGNLLTAEASTIDGVLDFNEFYGFVVVPGNDVTLELKLDIADTASNVAYTNTFLAYVDAVGMSSGVERNYDLYDRGIGSFQWVAKSYATESNLFLEFFGDGGFGMLNKYFIDASGKNNTVTCVSEATCPANEPEYHNYHYSASFDGVDDYLLVKNSTSLNIKEAVTVETWIKPNVTSSDASDWMIVGTKGFAYELTVSKKGVIRAGIINELNKRVLLDVSRPEIVNNWNHIVMTYDGSNIKLFLNGFLIGSKAQTGKMKTTATDLVIGKYSTTYHFNGMIDEFYVYDHELDANVILNHYNESPKFALVN